MSPQSETLPPGNNPIAVNKYILYYIIILSKVAEKNSKYPFPKLHFQHNQIKWSKTWLFYVLNYGVSCEEVPLNIDIKPTVIVHVNRICALHVVISD